MRAGRWATTPLATTKALQRTFRADAPSRAPVASTSAVPYSPPAAIVRARAAAQRLAQHTVTPSWLYQDARSALCKLLGELPNDLRSAKTGRRTKTARAALKAELAKWSAACRTIHALLSGPLADDWSSFRSTVARIVGHAMHLFIDAGMPAEASELERAFFGDDESPIGVTAVDRKGKAKAADPILRPEDAATHTYGASLGLKRRNCETAWTASVRLRLARLDTEGVGSLESLVATLVAEHGGTVGPSLTATLSQYPPVFLRKLEKLGVDQSKATWMSQRVFGRLHEPGSSTTSGRLEALDKAIDNLRDLSVGRWSPGHVERIELQLYDVAKEFGHPLDDQSQTPNEAIRPSPFQSDSGVLQYAQMLECAIRLALVRHRWQVDSHRTSRHDLLTSCSPLYAELAKARCLCSDRLVSKQLWKRESKALVHLAWASLGFHLPPSSSSRLKPVARAVPSSLSSFADILEHTLASSRRESDGVEDASSTPTSAQYLTPLGNVFWRQLVVSLSRKSTRGQAPDWTIVRRLLSLLLLSRRHDATVLNSTLSNERSSSWTVVDCVQPLMIRRSFVIALVRAVLLSPHAPAPVPMPDSLHHCADQAAMDAGHGPRASVRERLVWLIDWVDHMQSAAGEASVSPAVRHQMVAVPSLEWTGAPDQDRREWARRSVVTTDPRTMAKVRSEVIKRSVVRAAVEELVAREWGGVGYRAWADGLRAIVVEWDEYHKLDRQTAKAMFDARKQSTHMDEMEVKRQVAAGG